MNNAQQINPTRLELSKLKQRLATAERGQKLLKDKQNELVRSFVSMAKTAAALHEEVDDALESAMHTFALASLSLPDSYLQEACLIQAGRAQVDVDTRSILNVEIPRLLDAHETQEGMNALRYGYLNTNVDLDIAMEQFVAAFPKLLELSELEKGCEILSFEIESTRRRVNALEYKTIPTLRENIGIIQMKLEENERANITRLIKLKSSQEKAAQAK